MKQKKHFSSYHFYKKFWQYWPIRSSGSNFALIYGLVFLLSAIIFLSFTLWNTTNALNRHVQTAIEADAHDLIQKWNFGGPSALNDAINERLEQNVDDDALYLLIDPHGNRLSGNLPSWPSFIDKDNQFYELSIRRYQFITQAQLQAYPLSGNYHLIVGHDVRGRDLLRDIMTRTLIWCSLMISLLALGGALVIKQLFRHIVKSISNTASAVAQGDLTHRIPLNGSEIDVISETINTMLERINRLMEGVKQVSNAIAHDLRTPITRARTQLEDAALHAKDEESLRDAIENAVENLDHITGIFEALLRIAQIEAGTRRSAFTTVNLHQLLENMAEFYTASAEGKGLTLLLNIPQKLPTFFGDPHLLQQALANMLDNAIKFTPKNGHVTLSTTLIDKAENTASFLEINIIDQGPGMAEKDIIRAHERFFRADTARHTPGSGLGLSLVQAVAHLHQGTLSLHNEYPGLKVSLLLPFSQETSTLKNEECHE